MSRVNRLTGARIDILIGLLMPTLLVGCQAPARQLGPPRPPLSDAQLRSRAQTADLIIVGRVTQIRPMAVGVGVPRRISEHDPNWQEAVIEVREALKGLAADRVVVRFPGTMDVAYFGVPKFQAGQEGTFILQRDKLSGQPEAMVGRARLATFTAMGQNDVLPKRDQKRLKRLLEP